MYVSRVETYILVVVVSDTPLGVRGRAFVLLRVDSV